MKTKYIFIYMMLLSSLFLGQQKYNLNQFYDETGEFVKQPLKWNVSDFATLGIISAATYSLFYVDEDVMAFGKEYPGYDNNPLMVFSKLQGEPIVSIAAAAYFLINGTSSNNIANKKLGYEIAQSFFYTGVLTQSVKLAFGRSRPYNNLGAFKFEPLSFKNNDYMSLNSGHTAVAFSMWTVISENQNNYVLKYLCFVPPVLTGISRIYHDRHWLSDVFLGAAVGYFTAKWVTDQHKDDKLVEPNELITISIGIN